MVATPHSVALVGFGEAGRTFATAPGWTPATAVYDRLTDVEATRPTKQAEYQAAGVTGLASAAEAAADAGVVLSLVTADQALGVAVGLAGKLRPGALYLDLNSVAPETKRTAAQAIEASGARYVDVAVMAPVQPAALNVPLLVSGPHAAEAALALGEIGFAKISVAGEAVGRASSIKMIRSVMIKGLEALTAECVLAASEAGVLDEVIASLDASWPGANWASRADYNLDRMMVHGVRRAAEMQEVVRTLDDLGVGSDMSRGTVTRQAAIGARAQTPPDGLTAKVASLLERKVAAA